MSNRMKYDLMLHYEIWCNVLNVYYDLVQYDVIWCGAITQSQVVLCVICSVTYEMWCGMILHSVCVCMSEWVYVCVCLCVRAYFEDILSYPTWCFRASGHGKLYRVGGCELRLALKTQSRKLSMKLSALHSPVMRKDLRLKEIEGLRNDIKLIN